MALQNHFRGYFVSEKSKKYEAHLTRLVNEGDQLLNAIQYDCAPKEFLKKLSIELNNDQTLINEFFNLLPNFRSSYQSWYSEAQAVVKQLLPDRLENFNSYFEFAKPRKEITFQNYMIRDYLQGLRITRGGGYEIIADGSAAIPEFTQQLNIVKAAKDTLDSALIDLKGMLQADLFDTEIESAAGLAKAGFLRAAGAICGVVIEKHLNHVCVLHGFAISKKHPTINDLNQLLKDKNIISVPQWRHIQLLADIRNLCDHAKSKEPTIDEINDLVIGSKKY
jgi:hypothetical protein